MKPQNRDNEVGLVGATLRDSSRFEEVADIVRPEDFSWNCYGWAWKSMLSLHERGMMIDTITLGDELDREGKLDEFVYDGGGGVNWNGRAALSKIREFGDPHALESYAQKVLDYSAKRELLQLMNDGAAWSMNGRTANDIMSDFSKRMSEIRTFDGKSAEHTQSLSEVVSEAYDHTSAAANGEIQSVLTGYLDLDRILGGLSAPDVYIIAGRPGQGKTAFLSSVAMNTAQAKKRTAIFTLEMANRQIAMRLIAMESGVPFDRQKSGKLRDNEWPLYTHAVEVLSDPEKYPLVMNDLPAISIARMRQELRRIKVRLGGLDLIIMDYIQLGGVDGKYERRDLEIGEITRGLKSLGKEFNVPVLAAAQLSRAVEQRSDKKPVLSDLRESGNIENDADCVMFIYRPDQYEKDSSKQNTAEIVVAKHRNGPVGSIELVYRQALTRFENAASKIFRPNEPVHKWQERQDIGDD
jgi:replicative DNA helicase